MAGAPLSPKTFALMPNYSLTAPLHANLLSVMFQGRKVQYWT